MAERKACQVGGWENDVEKSDLQGDSGSLMYFPTAPASIAEPYQVGIELLPGVLESTQPDAASSGTCIVGTMVTVGPYVATSATVNYKPRKPLVADVLREEMRYHDPYCDSRCAVEHRSSAMFLQRKPRSSCSSSYSSSRCPTILRRTAQERRSRQPTPTPT
jgi:hypothetical protein